MKDLSQKPRLRVGMISLGCAKNLVDAEIMLGTLLKDGVQLTNNAEQADALIVNTCSFIDAAQEESVNTILESAQVREANHRGQALIVAGCLPQRFREELPKLLPEVDAFMGIDQVSQVSEIIRRALDERAQKTLARQAMSNAKAKRSISDNSKIVQKLALLERTTATASKPSPLVEVNVRPQYIPDYARRDFGSRHAILHM